MSATHSSLRGRSCVGAGHGTGSISCCKAHLPLPAGPLADRLALWLQGMLLAENGCLDQVVAALAARGGNAHTLRRRLCDGLKDDAERQEAWGTDPERDVEACFAPLLAWGLSWRVASGPRWSWPD